MRGRFGRRGCFDALGEGESGGWRPVLHVLGWPMCRTPFPAREAEQFVHKKTAQDLLPGCVVRDIEWLGNLGFFHLKNSLCDGHF